MSHAPLPSLSSLSSSSPILISFIVALATGCSSPSDPEQGATDDSLIAQDTGHFVGKARASGGVDVHIANATKTKCSDGTKKAQCNVPSVDYAALSLSSADQNAIDAAFKDGRAVIKGRLGMSIEGPHGQFPAPFPVLHAQKVWVGVAVDPAADSRDKLYLVHVEPMRAACVDVDEAKCQRFGHVEANASNAKPVEVQALLLPGVPENADADKAAAMDEVSIGAEGLLLLGHDDKTDSDRALPPTLVATNYFLPFVATRAVR